MYEYQFSRHLAYDRRMEVLRFAEEARRIAEAEKRQPPKNRKRHSSGISHRLQGLLSDSLEIARHIAHLI